MSASALRISAAVCAHLVLHCFSRSRSRLEACVALRVSAHLCDSLRFSSALSLYLTAPTALAPDYLLCGRVIDPRCVAGLCPCSWSIFAFAARLQSRPCRFWQCRFVVLPLQLPARCGRYRPVGFAILVIVLVPGRRSYRLQWPSVPRFVAVAFPLTSGAYRRHCDHRCAG